MIEYKCHQCGRGYSSEEYHNLDRKPVNPDEDNPEKGTGYEKICQCGAGFHTDKWRLLETVETDEREFTISTVGLLIAHGLDHNQWFETLVRWDMGDSITSRYSTKEEAKEGHKSVVEALRKGRFKVKDPQYATLEIDV